MKRKTRGREPSTKEQEAKRHTRGNKNNIEREAHRERERESVCGGLGEDQVFIQDDGLSHLLLLVVVLIRCWSTRNCCTALLLR